MMFVLHFPAASVICELYARGLSRATDADARVEAAHCLNHPGVEVCMFQLDCDVGNEKIEGAPVRVPCWKRWQRTCKQPMVLVDPLNPRGGFAKNSTFAASTLIADAIMYSGHGTYTH